MQRIADYQRVEGSLTLLDHHAATPVEHLTITPVILSGGAGTRMWPLSRSAFPKQFIDFFEGQDGTFLSQALRRLPAGAGFSPPIIICNNSHRFLVAQEAVRAGVSPKRILLEPVARNTAAAVAAAAASEVRDDPNSLIVVMPSDHIIRDPALFAERVRAGAAIAASGKLVLLGITPTEAHTGYGYVRRGAQLPGHTDCFVVDSFHEKPDAKAALGYLETGDYLWNSGIFVLPTHFFLRELKRLQPNIHDRAIDAVARAKNDLDFIRLNEKDFAASPSLSIDIAVMEKTDAAVVLPLDVGWTDVGSWSSVWDLASHDENGNAVVGDAMLEKSSGCYIHSEKAVVATIGVEDLIIVNTPDALLVADRARAQEVTSIVSRLKAADRSEYAQHLRDYRPWGYFERLSLGPRFQVKHLRVDPGGKLSMQMHHHRSEHWVVVQGTAKVTVGDHEQLVHENESVYIKATQWHRLENPGKVPLDLIEVQIGTYLGEDDIIRANDVYQRTTEEVG